MNRYKYQLFIAVIVGTMCFWGRQSDACCTEPDVWISKGEFWVIPGHEMSILAKDYAYVCIDRWEWTYPAGANVTRTECSTGCCGVECRYYFTFSIVGVYEDIKAQAYTCCTPEVDGNDIACVYVATMDITPSSPYPYIAVNDDDDNQDGWMDNYSQELDTDDPDNDLVPVELCVGSPCSSPDEVELGLINDPGALQVWNEPNRTGLLIAGLDQSESWTAGSWCRTVYVEGMRASSGYSYSDPRLKWYYFGGSSHDSLDGWNGTPSSNKRWTVVHVDMDMEGVKDEEYSSPDAGKTEETVPGGFVAYNDDDDNGNGTADRLENGPVNNENDLVKITIKRPLPYTLIGYVCFNVTEGAGKVRIWTSQTKGGTPVTLPAIYPLSDPNFPKELYVEGYETSSGLRDVTLSAYYTVSGKTFYDHIKLTIVDLNLTATDLYGTILDRNEEDPGAFIHFNLDNDNDSNNTVEGPKRPGADYADDTTPVTGENNLKPLSLYMTPLLSEGVVTLSNTSQGELWKDAAKGTGNLLLGPGGNLSWNLANSQQRTQFGSLCANPLYMEGASSTGGTVSLVYYSPTGAQVDGDWVYYHFIAADCGDQPRTEAEDIYEWNFVSGTWVPITGFVQRNGIESGQSLARCEYSITDNLAARSGSGGKRCSIPEYNCIAWSVDDTANWFSDVYIAHNYGDQDDIFELADVNDFYLKKKGWTPITSGTPEEKAAQAEAIYYSGFHAARKKSCGCGAGKWIMYESKLGQYERIEHVWDQVSGTEYGTASMFYK